MCETSVRKTYKEKLKPTPVQGRQLVLWRCRVLYNIALEQRIAQMHPGAVSRWGTSREQQYSIRSQRRQEKDAGSVWVRSAS